MSKDGLEKVVVLHAIAIVAVAAGVAAVWSHRRRSVRRPKTDVRPAAPKLELSRSGRVASLESFPHYVARQIGFDDPDDCTQLCNLASDYLRKTSGCEENILAFFSKNPNAESLYGKMIDELDKCILGYFAFHWSQASLLISQVLDADKEPKRKLKNVFMEATRKQRLERVARDLKVTRVFSTLVEEMKAIGVSQWDDPVRSMAVMVPAALADRSPVLLLMGGGMGAGKSTVLKDVLKQAFWLGAAANAVVVEADAFKESDVIYRALSSKGHHGDMLQTAELVHQSSTDAASSLLVTALNEGRDVIMDGTLAWEPFVYQTIAMARNVHRRHYRMGVGYKVAEDGTVTENYWEPLDEEEQDGGEGKKPYRIELVGVVCDAYLAVVRGMRRAILIGRAVRVKSQLKSHQRFANAFPRYCELVDNARLYCSNNMGTPPKLIAWKDGDNSLLVEPQQIICLEKVGKLNEDAESVYELYGNSDTTCGSSSVWNDVVLSASRIADQQELKAAVQAIEGHHHS